MYDNNTGYHVEEYDACKDGYWFEDEKGCLYIIPPNGTLASAEGPDNELLIKLEQLIAQKGWQYTKTDCDNLGVCPLPMALRRFSHEDGYYHV